MNRRRLEAALGTLVDHESEIKRGMLEESRHPEGLSDLCAGLRWLLDDGGIETIREEVRGLSALIDEKEKKDG